MFIFLFYAYSLISNTVFYVLATLSRFTFWSLSGICVFLMSLRVVLQSMSIISYQTKHTIEYSHYALLCELFYTWDVVWSVVSQSMSMISYRTKHTIEYLHNTLLCVFVLYLGCSVECSFAEA